MWKIYRCFMARKEGLSDCSGSGTLRAADEPAGYLLLRVH